MEETETAEAIDALERDCLTRIDHLFNQFDMEEPNRMLFRFRFMKQTVI